MGAPAPAVSGSKSKEAEMTLTLSVQKEGAENGEHTLTYKALPSQDVRWRRVLGGTDLAGVPARCWADVTVE